MEYEHVYDENKLCILILPEYPFVGRVYMKTPDNKFICTKSISNPSWLESLFGATLETKGIEAIQYCKDNIKQQIEKCNYIIRLQNTYGKDCSKTEEPVKFKIGDIMMYMYGGK